MLIFKELQMKYFVTILLISIFSCVNHDDEIQPFFVIEAFIYTGEPVEGIRIKELTPLDSGSAAIAPVIDNALVRLLKDDVSYTLNFDAISGTYFYSGADLEINNGDVFRLEVEANGRNAYAETVVPQPPSGVRKNLEKLIVPELVVAPDLREQIIELFSNSRLLVEWDNEDYLHYIVVQHHEDELDPILPEIVPEEARELISSFRFISEPTGNTSFDVVGVALETYGLHSAKVYRVNDEYADLFENDTQDSRDLNAPPTNVVGAFGIFSSFASDSVVFDVVRE